MAKKVELKFTAHQLNCLLEMVGTLEATTGGSDDWNDDGTDYDADTRRQIRSFDRMLKSNGYKR